MKRYVKWVAGLVILGIGVALYVEDVQRERRLRQATLIPHHEIQIEDLMVGFPYSTARVYNRSRQHRVNSLSIRITVDDCVGSDCTTVAEGNAFSGEDIPAGQARDVEFLGGVVDYKIKGKAHLSYKLTRVEAY